jgi:hypothetical protein
MPKIGFPELIILGMFVTLVLMFVRDRERN